MRRGKILSVYILQKNRRIVSVFFFLFSFPPPGTLGNPGNFLVVITSWENSVWYWHLVIRDQRYYRTPHSAQDQSPSTRNYLAHKIRNVEVEKIRSLGAGERAGEVTFR